MQTTHRHLYLAAYYVYPEVDRPDWHDESNIIDIELEPATHNCPCRINYGPSTVRWVPKSGDNPRYGLPYTKLWHAVETTVTTAVKVSWRRRELRHHVTWTDPYYRQVHPLLDDLQPLISFLQAQPGTVTKMAADELQLLRRKLLLAAHRPARQRHLDFLREAKQAPPPAADEPTGPPPPAETAEQAAVSQATVEQLRSFTNQLVASAHQAIAAVRSQYPQSSS